MKWFLGTYTARFNRRHKLFGHLFSGRYKAWVVDAASRGYLRTVGNYVPLNPVRVKRRVETTMTLAWIAARLEMGSGASRSNLL